MRNLLAIKKMSTSFKAYLKSLMCLVVFGFCAANVNAQSYQFFPLKVYSYNSKIPLGSIAEYRKDNVRFLGVDGDWVNIQVVGGIPAWFKKEDISVSADKSRASVIKKSARLYIEPSSTSRYLMTLKFGHAASIIEDTGQWVQVTSPNTLAIKVKKLDYDRIFPRFGNNPVLVSSDKNIPNAIEKKSVRVTSKPIVYNKANNNTSNYESNSRTPIEYTQTQIRNLPDATVGTYQEPTYVQSATSTDSYVANTVVNNSYQGASVYATTGLRDYQLTPGDVISISVFGERDMAVDSAKIPVNGNISFPLVGQVFVAGKTPSEVERLIESSLTGSYLSDPKVNLSIDVYRPVYVRGEVYSPGSYDFNVGLTVAKLLTTAGGATKDAIKDTVKLFRNNAIYLENLNVDSQELIHPGDIVSVEERPEEIVVEEVEAEATFIYLHGEVSSAGEYEYRPGLTVEKAIALAGGFGPRASKKRISITREVVGEEAPEKIKKVNLYMALQAGDIIHVGESWF